MPTWVSLAGYVIAPVATLIAVWMTSRFAWRRSQSEKIWDRKANAYSAILQALHDMDGWFDENMHDEMLQREPSDEVIAERSTSYNEARKALRSVIGREIWLLAPDVKATVREMDKVLQNRHESWFEHLDAGGAAVGTATKAITALAVRELGTRRTR